MRTFIVASESITAVAFMPKVIVIVINVDSFYVFRFEKEYRSVTSISIRG